MAYSDQPGKFQLARWAGFVESRLDELTPVAAPPCVVKGGKYYTIPPEF